MYMVVSYWEAFPGKEADFEASSPDVTAILRRQPGVCLIESFKSDGKYVAVHAYEDEASYRAIVYNPNGAFARALQERGTETFGRWISSERGETLPHKQD
jgi:heme-degrading monooxygenase HmoA